MESANATSSAEAAPPVTGSGGSWRLARLGVPAALFIYTLCVFVPWTLPPPPDDLDASWNAVLHWAFVHHLDFGHDLVFTYGPWGFVIVRYLPSTFKWVVAAWTVFSVGFFAAIWKISRELPSRAWGAAWAALVITVAGAPLRQYQDVRMDVLSALLLVIHFYVDDRPWPAGKVMLSFGMAWMSLIKFSSLFISLPVVAVVSVDQIARRRIPSMLIVYVAGYLGLWLLAGQPLSSLAPYLRHSWIVAQGYSDGAELVTLTEHVDIVLFAITCGLLLATAVMALGRQRKSLLVAAGLMGILLPLFKAGYVRHDLHELIATASVALISLAVGAAAWPRTRAIAGRGLILVSCIGSLCLTSYSGTVSFRTSEPVFMLLTVAQIPGSVLTAIRWGAGSASFEEQYARLRQTMPAELKSEIVGSVDKYSTGQRALVDSGLEYSPRPVFQSYLAYTWELSRLNAEFLAGPRAARTVLFGMQPIDRNYPSLEDAQSWPELLTRYDPIDALQSSLVLRRAEAPRGFTLIPLGAGEGRMSHLIRLPDSDDPIWAVIRPRVTTLGAMRRAIYKLPALLLGVETQSGRDLQSFRLLRSVGEGGFLLSPLVTDQLEFATLYAPEWKEEMSTSRVVKFAVAVSDTGNSPYFEPEYSVELYSLHYPHRDVSAVPGMGGYLSLRKCFKSMTVMHADGAVEFGFGDEGEPILSAQARSQIFLPIPTGATRLRIGFGMLQESYMGAKKTDGVEFRLGAVDKHGADGLGGSLIWSRSMDPANRPADRGTQTVEIQLPATALALVLETNPGPLHQKSDSYWTELKFR